MLSKRRVSINSYLFVFVFFSSFLQARDSHGLRSSDDYIRSDTKYLVHDTGTDNFAFVFQADAPDISSSEDILNGFANSFRAMGFTWASPQFTVAGERGVKLPNSTLNQTLSAFNALVPKLTPSSTLAIGVLSHGDQNGKMCFIDGRISLGTFFEIMRQKKKKVARLVIASGQCYGGAIEQYLVANRDLFGDAVIFTASNADRMASNTSDFYQVVRNNLFNKDLKLSQLMREYDKRVKSNEGTAKIMGDSQLGDAYVFSPGFRRRWEYFSMRKQKEFDHYLSDLHKENVFSGTLEKDGSSAVFRLAESGVYLHDIDLLPNATSLKPGMRVKVLGIGINDTTVVVGGVREE